MSERAQQVGWLSSILEQTPTAPCLVELGTGRVLYSNRAAERLALKRAEACCACRSARATAFRVDVPIRALPEERT